MGLSAIFIFNTVSYGTIAGTWLPAIPPFDIRNRHFWKSPPPSRTFLMFLMGLPAIFKIYTVSYGTIGDTSIWFLKPPFFEISAPLLEHSCCFLWNYRRYLYLALFLMGLSPGLDYRRYLHFWKSPPPSRTFLMFLMGLPAMFKIYTVSYGTIGDTSIWFLKPLFFKYPPPF